MKNYVQPGDTLTLVAPSGGVESGVPRIIGDLFVVPTVTADDGQPFAAKTTGVYELPKTSAQAWTQCAKVYWDANNGVATTAASGNREIGVAVKAAANPSALGLVRLNGISLPAAGA